MRIKAFILGTVAAIAMTGGAYAQEGLGIGLILGEPTGVSVKTWLNERNAIDMAAGWSFSQNDSFQFHADYLVHSYTVIRPKETPGKFPVYVGVGGRLKLEEENDGRGRNDHDDLIGIRIPFGLSYLFDDVPVDLFFEIVPILDLVPDSHFAINAALGARFYIR